MSGILSKAFVEWARDEPTSIPDWCPLRDLPPEHDGNGIPLPRDEVEFFRQVLAGKAPGPASLSPSESRALLADRDWWEAEARRLDARWRSRVPLAGDDVAAAGLIADDLRQWLTGLGWAPSEKEGTTRMGRAVVGRAQALTTWRAVPRTRAGVDVPDERDAHDDIADAIRTMGHHLGRSSWDIFDEIARVAIHP